jgi:hypothetical protein
MILLFIYIYIEKKVFYNIEGQLKGVPGFSQPKNLRTALLTVLIFKHLYACKRVKNSLPAKTPAPLQLCWRRRLKILAKVPVKRALLQNLRLKHIPTRLSAHACAGIIYTKLCTLESTP